MVTAPAVIAALAAPAIKLAARNADRGRLFLAPRAIIFFTSNLFVEGRSKFGEVTDETSLVYVLPKPLLAPAAFEICWCGGDAGCGIPCRSHSKAASSGSIVFHRSSACKVEGVTSTPAFCLIIRSADCMLAARDHGATSTGFSDDPSRRMPLRRCPPHAPVDARSRHGLQLLTLPQNRRALGVL
jgi:hypothetical protein